MSRVVIIGAGLCGSLMALRLAQRGFEVEVYEKRPDMRQESVDGGRSINLALSDRGLKGLEMVGLKEKALELVIPMKGRMIHDQEGNQKLYSYSGRPGEVINSISREGLNILLMNEAEETGKVTFNFNTFCRNVDYKEGTASLVDSENTTHIVKGDIILGTDGAFSAVRQSLLKHSGSLRFQYQQDFLDTGYKELSIPPGKNGDFLLEPHALHIWPRKGFMLIALPNLDRSFTVTLFLPFEGEHSFEALQNEKDVKEFFNTYFSSAVRHMPDLWEEFQHNPSSSLCTIKCFPWQINGKVVLMGDAAHAVVPFYGQGMNASFEDCVVLDQCLDRFPGDWVKISQHFESLRKENADAIGDLAVDNFYEMKAATANPVFNLKRQIELDLEQNFPDYFSKYSMVTFREDLPYKTAMDEGRKQDEILMKFAEKIYPEARWDRDEVRKLIS